MADDQRPESFDDALAQQSTDALSDPSGEQLAVELPELGDSYEILDADAEELEMADEQLDPTPLEADPADVVIDDAAQLAAAEQVAAKARSSRPVKKSSVAAAEVEPSAEEPIGSSADAADQVASRRPVKRTGATAAEPTTRRPVRRAPVDKSEANLPTPSRKKGEVAAPRHRTTPVEFVNQSVGELRKVIWPTADQLRQYFIVVLVFVLFIIAYVSVLDYGFGWILLKLLGN